MTTSQTANAALLRSLQRVRDRQARSGTIPKSGVPDNAITSPKPQWNPSTSYHPTKIPRSIFLDPNRSVDNVVQSQRIYSGSTNRSTSNNNYNTTELTTPVKVVRLPPTVNDESRRMAPVYYQHPQQTYQTNTKFIRTDPEVIVVESQSTRQSWFNCFRRNKTYRTNYYGDTDVLLNPPVRLIYSMIIV